MVLRLRRFSDRIQIVIVPPVSHEMEDMFVLVCQPVFHTCRQCVWLVPDYVVAKNPSLVDQSEGYTPRYSYQTLRRKMAWSCGFFGIRHHRLFAESRGLPPMLPQDC